MLKKYSTCMRNRSNMAARSVYMCTSGSLRYLLHKNSTCSSSLSIHSNNMSLSCFKNSNAMSRCSNLSMATCCRPRMLYNRVRLNRSTSCWSIFIRSVPSHSFEQTVLQSLHHDGFMLCLDCVLLFDYQILQSIDVLHREYHCHYYHASQREQTYC